MGSISLYFRQTLSAYACMGRNARVRKYTWGTLPSQVVGREESDRMLRLLCRSPIFAYSQTVSSKRCSPLRHRPALFDPRVANVFVKFRTYMESLGHTKVGGDYMGEP